MKKRYVLLLILFLTIGFASITINLYFHGDIILGKNNLINSVYISDVDYEASISNDEEEFIFTLSDANNYRIEYTVGNKELQYDALVNVECDGNTSVINYPEDKQVGAQEKVTSYITINKTDNNEEEITCRIVNVLLEKDEIATQKIFKLIFDPNTGSLGRESKNVMINDSYGWLPEPTKTNYNFLGWYTEVEGGSLVTSETILTESQNITIYAHWSNACIFPDGYTWDFAYNGTDGTDGSIQEFKIPCTGTYKLEVWGASGNVTSASNVTMGYGGYSVGEINLNNKDVLSIGVGGSGKSATGNGNYAIALGGYNGGGSGKDYLDGRGAGAGGGATHIALNNNLGILSNYVSNISDILIVAGGGGGVGNFNNLYPSAIMLSGSGGGIIGGTGKPHNQEYIATGGTQDNGGLVANNTSVYKGTSGKFGEGGNCSSAPEGNCSGGGGGFFGGGSGSNYSGAGGGGSGYIANTKLFNKSMSIYCTSNCSSYASNVDNTKTNITTTANSIPVSESAKSGNGYARITLVSGGGNPNSISSKIITNNELITASPTLTTSSNNTSDASGLYVSYDTNSGLPTYYFRGNVNNNYVDFAGFTWRIVRINEDGTIRLVMQDGINNSTQYSFNSEYNSYNYMYYSNTTSKTTINNWYKSNITDKGFSNYIVSGEYFCEEAKVYYNESEYTNGNANMILYTNYSPNFKCKNDGNGKGIYSSSVGLLNYDEVVYAGGTRLSANNSYYLYNGVKKWTMSPAGYYILSPSSASVWNISDTGKFADWIISNETGALNPVINLKGNIIMQGSGTISDKYRLS